MTSLARVDGLRALPPPRARRALGRLEAELGPEAVGALERDRRFWQRPAQRFPRPDERPAIVVYVGEYGAGKTWTAVELFLHLILAGRAKRPRVICATGADVAETIVDGPSGILAWAPVGVVCDWQSSKGHEGELTVDGIKVACLSADAPRQALGAGADVQLLDDPPKWGPSGRDAFVAALKSSRERGSLTIIPTTMDGLQLLGEVLEQGELAGVLVIDLGETAENAGNLSRNFVEIIIPALKRAGKWNPLAGASPWAPVFDTMGARLRLAASPLLVEMGIAIDPNLSAGTRSCEVGIVGGGKDHRSTVHLRYDRSAVLDSGRDGWPKAAWDLAVELGERHPGVPWHFVLEANTGKRLQELLRGEERARRLRGDRVPLPGGGWAQGQSEVSVCEIRLVKADKDKCRRAESPARLAAQGGVLFALDLRDLEGQLRNLTPASTSSDRADAGNHLVNDLAGLGDEKAADRELARVSTVAAFTGLRDAQRPFAPPAFRGDRV